MGDEDDDVILVCEERKLTRELNYAIWPGDLKHGNKQKQPVEIIVEEEEASRNNKRKRDDSNDEENVEDDNTLNKRACNNNRYFSSENMRRLQDEPTTSTSTTASRPSTSSAAESEDFVRRRDYLMTKLLQSRNLPGDTTTTTTTTTTSSTTSSSTSQTTTSLNTEKISLSSPAPLMSRPVAAPRPVNDEFIPIRFEPPLRIEDTFEHVNGSRLEPYPVAAIKRASEHLKYLFSEQSPFVLYESNQNQRTFEIVKLKLGLKSKFENDLALKRRIERADFAAMKSIHDRKREIDSKLAKKLTGTKTLIIDLCSSDEDDSEDSDDDDYGKRKKTNGKNKNQTDETTSHSEESEDEKSLIEMIEREDRIDLDSTSDESEDRNVLAKGRQKKRRQQQQHTKEKKITRQHQRTDRGLEVSSIRQAGRTGKRAGSKEKSAKGEDGVDELEREYASLRNRKMKLRKKRSKTSSMSKQEVDMERKLLNGDMRKLRRAIRKLKNNQRTSRTTTTTTSTSKSSSPKVSLDGVRHGGGVRKSPTNHNSNNTNNKNMKNRNNKKKIQRQQQQQQKSPKQFRIIKKPRNSNRFFYPKF